MRRQRLGQLRHDPNQPDSGGGTAHSARLERLAEPRPLATPCAVCDPRSGGPPEGHGRPAVAHRQDLEQRPQQATTAASGRFEKSRLSNSGGMPHRAAPALGSSLNRRGQVSAAGIRIEPAGVGARPSRTHGRRRTETGCRRWSTRRGSSPRSAGLPRAQCGFMAAAVKARFASCLVRPKPAPPRRLVQPGDGRRVGAAAAGRRARSTRRASLCSAQSNRSLDAEPHGPSSGPGRNGPRAGGRRACRGRRHGTRSGSIESVDAETLRLPDRSAHAATGRSRPTACASLVVCRSSRALGQVGDGGESDKRAVEHAGIRHLGVRPQELPAVPSGEPSGGNRRIRRRGRRLGPRSTVVGQLEFRTRCGRPDCHHGTGIVPQEQHRLRREAGAAGLPGHRASSAAISAS